MELRRRRNPRSLPNATGHLFTPHKPRFISADYYDMENLEQTRKRHRDNAARGRTRACHPNLFFATYAPKHKLLSSSQRTTLIRALSKGSAFHPSTNEWAALPMPRTQRINDDPNNPVYKTEDAHFKGLETVVAQILSAAEETLPKRYSPEKRTTEFMCQPTRITLSETTGSSQRMDNFFVRRTSSYPSGLDLNRNPEVSVEDTEAPRVIYTADVTAAGESKTDEKPKDKLDNQKKVCGHQGHIFQNDIGRFAVFTYTIERSKLRVWFHTRSHSAVTTEIDIYNHDEGWFFEFILFMTYAPYHELGIDPSVRRVLDKERHLQYQFDIYPSKRCKKPAIYQTVRVLDESSGQTVYSRAMRVFDVRLVIKNSDDPEERTLAEEANVLRDYWVYEDVSDEKVIQSRILERIGKLKGVASKAKKHFMAILQDGIVRHPSIKDEKSGTVPSPPKAAKPFRFELDDNPARAKPAKSQIKESEEVRTPAALQGNIPGAPKIDAVPLLQLHGKKHCRTVYKQLCMDLYKVNDPAVFFHALAEVMQILHYFKLIGYVHRDVSPGNFLLHHISGALPDLPQQITRDVLKEWVTIVSDLEYARPYTGSLGHDPLTGTVYYTAIEVQGGRHRFVDAADTDLDEEPTAQAQDTKSDPTSNFAFTFYHDIESAVWMAIDFITRKMPKTILDGRRLRWYAGCRGHQSRPEAAAGIQIVGAAQSSDDEGQEQLPHIPPRPL
ncbi:hypothetical protein K525DRAFT_197847 [Schizophyllum commune Loenen D]|nr:hypothetical protein K525DRAFT_197847 [Schizophyllum commune Loenen D]